MTKNEGSVVDRMRGYIDAKREARSDQVFSDRAIMALNMAYTILEKEIALLENKKKLDAMEIDSLEKKLREKTYPIDREYLLKKERDEYKELADLRSMNVKGLIAELKRANDKIGLQRIEIGKLQGLLKEADKIRSYHADVESELGWIP